MPNDFFGLQIGMSALYASRRQMEIAAQNVANANTEGYSRQRVNISTAGVSTVAAVHARSVGGGSGVTVDSIGRSSDQFLVARSHGEHSNLAYLNRSQTILDRIELTFNEPSETGIQSQLADFWAGWEDVSNNPGNLAARSQLMERAGTLVTSVNQASHELGELWRTSVDQLRTVVVGVNAAARMVADLNGAIKRASAAGLNPNELLDRRDNLALELAARIGGEVRNVELGQINVFVGGTALVRGEIVEEIEVHVPATSNIMTSADPTGTDNVYLRWKKDSFRATVTGGESAGLLDALNRMLPHYRSAITGPAAEAATFTGATMPTGPLSTDFAAAPASFQLSVDGGAFTTITLDTDLSAPGTTAGDLGAAITSALRDAGIMNVTATAVSGGGGWTVSLTGGTYGSTSSLGLRANGVDPLFGQLFGTGAQATTVTGNGMPSAALTVDYSGGGSQSLLIDGVAVTLNTNLVGATPAAFAAALNTAIATAGLTGVTAGVQDLGAGSWSISITGSSSGATSAIDVAADGASPLHAALFGAGVSYAQQGVGDPAVGPSLAYQLATLVNLQHRQGVELSGADGGNFLEYSVADGLAMTFTDPGKLAAAAQGRPLLDGLNASNVGDISSIANGPDNTFRTLIINLGVEAQTVNRRVDIQQDITNQIDSAREGEAGVSIDEEMANMVQFQHTYAAASRMMTAIDEMLDRLINGTGLVGR